MFEAKCIQEAFMRHFGVDEIPKLRVPDGDYIVPVYDEDFNVRMVDNRMWMMPADFDETKATRIERGGQVR